ncbi:MAG TPA: carboxypeptidase regulatory-like domain-containing protein [Candidatus Fraserbacteria bacterium]|nr:carboxypeptidase regulatory-like domain-containing protein [Candidatus Fraserbacteria bacterium]
MRKWRGIVGIALLLAAAVTVWWVWHVTEVKGLILEGGHPLVGVVVRVKATDYETTTDEHGAFVLKGFPPAFRLHVTAWVDGYYVGGGVAWPWRSTVIISLQRYWTSDNPHYAWIPPKVEDRSALTEFLMRMGLATAARLSFNKLFLPLASRLELGCADCHGRTIYDQWAASAHAQGTNNIRFQTMYNGTDTRGHKSPPTRQGYNRDYGSFPLRPDPSQPYYGPGFKLDFPDQAGNCASCHMPTEAVNAPYDTDITRIESTALQGISCDICHKVADVRVDPTTQLPYENMPGVLSMKLRRPNGEPQMFFGPYDDVDVGPDTFSPLQNKSRFCAACHNASFWGTPIYQSYSEWLASPYPQEGKTCQACHMKPDGVTSNFAPGRGGVKRDPKTIFTHNFPGAANVELLQNTAKLELSAHQEGDRLLVEVRVTNENAGHDIPTDHPMRNILLVVSASDAQGHKLEFLGDQIIPDWGGVGDEPDDYGGRPGKGYAKILEERWTEVSPTAAYWNPTVIREDTRIPAKATDVTHYEFRLAERSGPITVEAKLIFRRAFKQLVEQKKWKLKDILMEDKQVIVP